MATIMWSASSIFKMVIGGIIGAVIRHYISIPIRNWAADDPLNMTDEERGRVVFASAIAVGSPALLYAIGSGCDVFDEGSTRDYMCHLTTGAMLGEGINMLWTFTDMWTGRLEYE